MTQARAQKNKPRVIVTGAGSPIIVDGGVGGTKWVDLVNSKRPGYCPQSTPDDIKVIIKEEVNLVVLDDGSIGWGNVRREHLRSASIAAAERFCELEDEKFDVTEMTGKTWMRDSFQY